MQKIQCALFDDALSEETQFEVTLKSLGLTMCGKATKLLVAIIVIATFVQHQIQNRNSFDIKERF